MNEYFAGHYKKLCLMLTLGSHCFRCCWVEGAVHLTGENQSRSILHSRAATHSDVEVRPSWNGGARRDVLGVS